MSHASDAASTIRACCYGLKTGTDVQGSESQLLSLRTRADAFDLFASAIQTLSPPSDSFELFHSIVGLQSVVLLSYDSLPLSQKRLVRDWFLNLGLQSGDGLRRFDRACSNAALGAAAVLWKRGWGEESSQPPPDPSSPPPPSVHAQVGAPFVQSPAHLFQHLRSSSSSGPDAALSSATFLSSLLGEMGASSRSTAGLNCSYEFHDRTRRLFEGRGNGLDGTLDLAMAQLSGVIAALGAGQHNATPGIIPLSTAVCSLTTDVLSWEFDASLVSSSAPSSSSSSSSSSAAPALLIKPPVYYSQYLIRPDFLGAIFSVYGAVRLSPTVVSPSSSFSTSPLSHALRQLLLQLASLSGPIFSSDATRVQYAAFFVDGLLGVLSNPSRPAAADEQEREVLDVASIISRIALNFKLNILQQLPNFPQLLKCTVDLSATLIAGACGGVVAAGGDLSDCDSTLYQFEACQSCLDALTALATQAPPTASQMDGGRSMLGEATRPLYPVHVEQRIRACGAEERFNASTEAELDAENEDIAGFDFAAECESLSIIGRLNFAESLAFLGGKLEGDILPRLAALLSSAPSSDVSPDAAATLEEARVAILCLGHLLADDPSAGETPMVPDAVILSFCSPSAQSLPPYMLQLLSSLMRVAEFQASQITTSPSNPNLSPILGETLLWFLTRFASVYVLPDASIYTTNSPVLHLYSSSAPGAQSPLALVDFCVTLCTHYFCFWPQESAVFKAAQNLLINGLARNVRVRALLPTCEAWGRLANLFNVGARLRHLSNPLASFDPSSLPSLSLTPQLVGGFFRLNYSDRGEIAGILICGCWGQSHANSAAVLNQTLVCVQQQLQELVQTLTATPAHSHNPLLEDLARSSIELYGGISRVHFTCERGEHSSKLLSSFMSQSLTSLAHLMNIYGKDVTMCNSLLRLFKDYTSSFINNEENPQESIILYNSVSELLKNYCIHHVNSSTVRSGVASNPDEEEEMFGDVLLALELLRNISTKDFFAISSSSAAAGGAPQVEITDVVFHGLSQIMPVITGGLLQYPSLCKQFYSLMGDIVKEYPEKLVSIHPDLFDKIVETLIWGLTNVDVEVGRQCADAIGELAKSHMQTGSLAPHLARKPDLFNVCVSVLLEKVAFHTVVLDRLDAVGGALMALIAVDVNFFVQHVTKLVASLGAGGGGAYQQQQQTRLMQAFEKLVVMDLIGNVNSHEKSVGMEARKTFKANFKTFILEVHSFMRVM